MIKKITCGILLFFYLIHPLYAEKKGNMTQMKIHSVSIKGEDFFDHFLPQNFYQNFAEGKFSRNIYPRFSDRTSWERVRTSPYANLILANADNIKVCRRSLEIKSDLVIVNDTVGLTKPNVINITFLTPSGVQILNSKKLKIGNVILECENIEFESQEKMPLMEGQKPHPETPIWRCNLTALRFKTDKNNYRFIFRR